MCKRVQSWAKGLNWGEVGWGIAVGLLGLLGSWLFVRVRPGRLLGNPMPIVLAFSALGRALGQGLAYFNWRPPLFHLGFIGLLAGTSGALAGWRSSRGASAAQTIARTAVSVNLIVSALIEVDALIVLIFYAGAGYLTLSAAGLVARRTASWIRTRSRSHLTC